MTEETAGTPRTDAEEFYAEKDTSDKWEQSSCNVYVVDADFARQLEREVAALTEQLKAEKAKILAPANTDWGRGMLAERAALTAELTAAKRALAELLLECQHICNGVDMDARQKHELAKQERNSVSMAIAGSAGVAAIKIRDSIAALAAKSTEQNGK